MAKQSKRNKKSSLAEAIQETQEGLVATGVIPSTEPTTELREKKKLDVNTVSVTPAKLPPNKRLFPASLLAELDEIKERLEKLEKTLSPKSE